MRYVTFYFSGSVVIGLLLTIDSVMLLLSAAGVINLLFSYLEYLWLPLSIVAVVFLVRDGLPILVPVSYLVYTVLTWMHAFYMVSQHPDPANIRLPIWVALLCVAFGIYFTVVSWMAKRSLPRSQVV